MPGFVFSKGVFCFDKILWASYLAVHAHELTVLLHYAHSGLSLTGGKRNSDSVDIPYFDSHLHCCGVSVPGEARLRGGLRRSQNAEKLQAWAEARAAVSLIGLLAVCARRRGEA